MATELTNKQLDMLCEMAEVHFEWFQKHSPESNITFGEVLKLNHQKMLNLTKSCLNCNEEMLDLVFRTMIKDYREMVEIGNKKE